MSVFVCLLLLFKTLTRSSCGKKGFISYYTSRSHSITAGSQSRNSNRTWSRHHGVSLLTGLLPMASAQSTFYTTQDLLPKGCTTYINQQSRRGSSYDRRQSDLDSPPTESPSSLVTLGCVKLAMRTERKLIYELGNACTATVCTHLVLCPALRLWRPLFTLSPLEMQ